MFGGYAMLGIGLNDMRLSDKFVFDWLRKEINRRGEAVLTSSQIGDSVGCHRNTVREICNRLESAGLIEIERRSLKQGYVYRLPKNA